MQKIMLDTGNKNELRPQLQEHLPIHTNTFYLREDMEFCLIQKYYNIPRFKYLSISSSFLCKYIYILPLGFSFSLMDVMQFGLQIAAVKYQRL